MVKDATKMFKKSESDWFDYTWSICKISISYLISNLYSNCFIVQKFPKICQKFTFENCQNVIKKWLKMSKLSTRNSRKFVENFLQNIVRKWLKNNQIIHKKFLKICQKLTLKIAKILSENDWKMTKGIAWETMSVFWHSGRGKSWRFREVVRNLWTDTALSCCCRKRTFAALQDS